MVADVPIKSLVDRERQVFYVMTSVAVIMWCC
jgi:hypothetical protein